MDGGGPAAAFRARGAGGGRAAAWGTAGAACRTRGGGGGRPTAACRARGAGGGQAATWGAAGGGLPGAWGRAAVGQRSAVRVAEKREGKK
jgi:hypothetical protein